MGSFVFLPSAFFSQCVHCNRYDKPIEFISPSSFACLGSHSYLVLQIYMCTDTMSETYFNRDQTLFEYMQEFAEESRIECKLMFERANTMHSRSMHTMYSNMLLFEQISRCLSGMRCIYLSELQLQYQVPSTLCKSHLKWWGVSLRCPYNLYCVLCVVYEPTIEYSNASVCMSQAGSQYAQFNHKYLA